ncbi:MAG: hypothetical protein CMJ83_17360 [Planctomycetes bacterium]|nr:hypothetical protein [Planctomycetota bacterium]
MRQAILTAATLAAAVAFTGCGTGSQISVTSSPPGARIYVQGVDTRKVTPARLDLERYARDADQPMPIMVKLDGHVSTRSWPYSPRHQCANWFCEHKHRHYLPCRLHLQESGTGIRIDIFQGGWEVRLDDGAWIVPSDPSPFGDAHSSLTLEASPGVHRVRYRKHDLEVRHRYGQSDYEVTVPADGYLQLNLLRHP